MTVTAPIPTDAPPTLVAEHVLIVVEPSGDGDATLEIGRSVIARGGQVSVLMLVTDRIERDIRDFAASEDLDHGTAEAQALDQLTQFCIDRLGVAVDVQIAHVGRARIDLETYIDTRITAIAVPQRLYEIGRLHTSGDRVLILAPRQADAAA